MSDAITSAFDQELWRSRLRGADLRVTLARLAVVRALAEASAPISAGELLSDLGGARVDRVTLYRTLGALCRAGLAMRTDPGDRVWRFALAPDEHTRHGHVVCDSCGSMTCMDEAILSAVPAGRTGRRARFRLNPQGVMLHGTCETCLGAE